MGPLRRFSSFFSASVVDVNNNSSNMGAKGKKNKFSSDLDIFTKDAERLKGKSQLWTSLKTQKNKKGKNAGWRLSWNLVKYVNFNILNNINAVREIPKCIKSH
ncbi:hypothetical protein WA026_008377 [Henosepilachna vigintioctopunctata]|uniref:Uncharacterized protein n=1 Tax=Henosepilachna vigintioctopunctata TaxID=420089 RepID=A0AAW1UII5_9CUCU